jgi:excisionase family DNA binding protein
MTLNSTPRTGNQPGDRLLSIAELAGYLGVPVATIYQWRHHCRGPTGYRIGRHVRYRSSEIEDWLDTQRDPMTLGRGGDGMSR